MSSIARKAFATCRTISSSANLIFGTEAVAAAASRDNWAAFIELSIPILKNLELSLAGRYDDYSDSGNSTNPKVAVRWAPIESLALRASWGTGFRAPSLRADRARRIPGVAVLRRYARLRG